MSGIPNFRVMVRDYTVFPCFKYQGIWQMFKENPLLLEYDYYFMPDEDILIGTEDINLMFAKMRTLNLALAHPSIEDSNTSFPSREYLIHQEGIDLMMTNFIEIGSPVFSREALLKCLDTFRMSMSGWGLDWVWAKLLDHKDMAILHSIVAKHTRKVGGGGLYSELKKVGVSPSRERKKLMSDYGITDMTIKTWM